MNKEISDKRIAIIGSGMSGLTIANKLSAANEVVIFDKSRGVGGRMATKRTENYHFDHGAQFFIAKGKEFKEFCQKAKDDDIIQDWQCRFSEIIDGKVNRNYQFDSKKPHFVSKPQMNSVCKYIAKDLNILLNKQIKYVNFDNNKWSLQDSQEEVYGNFDYLILAIPSHQAIDLIPKNFKYFKDVKNVKMSGCFTVMLGFKQDLEMDFDAALIKGSNISWISVNSSKPERPGGFCMIVNSTNKWADDNIEEDLEVVKSQIISSLRKLVDFDLKDIDYQNIHRWRYANSPPRSGNKSFFDPNLNLGVCGDWAISGRIESAFLSGLELYKNISNQ